MWIRRRKSHTPKNVFLHVPKTGGMTFQKILKDVFPGSFHFCIKPTVRNIRRKLNAYDCIELHGAPYKEIFTYMTQEIMKPGHWELLHGANIYIVFRNPLEQTLSLFSYLQWQQDTIRPLYKSDNRRFPETLTDFIETEPPNKQTEFLLGNMQSRTGQIIAQADLEYAKSLLVNLNIKVGIMERYADFLHLFETVSRKKIPKKTIAVINKNPLRISADAISEATRQTILEKNYIDVALYDFAKKLFEKQLADCDASPNYLFKY